MNNIEQLEPFEKRIVRIFALIASFVTFLIAYFILISTAYLEFVPTVFPSHVPLQLITSAVAILYLVYFIVFIIKAIKKNDQTDVPDSLLPPHFLFQFHALRRCSGSSPASRCGRAGALLPACGRSGLITGFAASTAAGLFPAGSPGLFLSTGSLDGGLCCFTRHIEKSLSGAGRQLPAGAPS